ncbi:MAG: hypothetical protein JRN68_00275 [Nitrososphaerota archaeon]|nr:hypothetical protein [Nitrososphaerota archaeon]
MKGFAGRVHHHWAIASFAFASLLIISLVASVYPFVDTNFVENCVAVSGTHNAQEKCPAAIFRSRAASERIAFVEPVFTTTAYSSFYKFYAKYSKVPLGQNVTTDLNLLNVTVVMGWGHSNPLYLFLRSKIASQAGLIVGDNAFILTDIDVDQGKLFSPTNGSRLYDYAVLGFSEYVTSSEYRAFERFVATGGTLVILSATTFLAQVAYYPSVSKVALVGGNTWYFNGVSAWKGPLGRWSRENTNWVGSNYALFYASERYSIYGATANASDPYGWALSTAFGPRLFDDYFPHEENLVTNSTDRVIALWNLKGYNGTLAIYEHQFGKGRVIHVGAFGTDILVKDIGMQFFLLTVLGLLQVNARVATEGCRLIITAWPTFPRGANLTASTSYVVFGGRTIQMANLGSQIFQTSLNICPSSDRGADVYIFASSYMSGFVSVPLNH